jgi:hypothetical protein
MSNDRVHAHHDVIRHVQMQARLYPQEASAGTIFGRSSKISLVPLYLHGTGVAEQCCELTASPVWAVVRR